MTNIFGARITLRDYNNPVVQTEAIGLYNTGGDLTSNAASGQADVVILNSATNDWQIGNLVHIYDDDDQELGRIALVTVGATHTTITLDADLTNAYAIAKNAHIDGPSQFRWLQNDITGLGITWRTDMLVPGGIGKIIRNADLTNGGNVAELGGTDVSVTNTRQFWNTLMNTLEISLTGMSAEVIHFADTTEAVIWRGVCQQPTWTRSTYNIPLRSDRVARNANITKEQNVTGQDEKVTIPATFGEWSDSLSSLVRTTQKEITQKFYHLLFKMSALHGSTVVNFWTTQIAFRQIFPIVDSGTEPSVEYTIQIGTSSFISFLDFGSIDTSDQSFYVKVIEDDNAVGTYRKINAIEYVSATNIKLVVSNYYKNDPVGEAAGNEAWIMIQEIEREYKLDYIPCYAFLSQDKVEISSAEPNAALDLFVYDQNDKVTTSGEAETVRVTKSELGLFLIPPYVYLFESGNTDNNSLVADPLFFNDSIDRVKSYKLIPLTKPTAFQGVLSTWLDPSEWSFIANISNYKMIVPGWYQRLLQGNINVSDDADNKLNSIDRQTGTIWKPFVNIITQVEPPPTAHIVGLWTFEMPTYPEFDFDELYLCSKISASQTKGVGRFATGIMWRRFLGYGNTIYKSPSNANYWTLEGNISHTIDTLPDFYYTANPDTKNKNFYVESADTNRNVTGHTLYKIANIKTEEQYKSIENVAFMSYFSASADSGLVYKNDIYDISVAFAKNLSVGENLYTKVKGRIFNNTWGDRVTSANMIESPLDLYEAFCRWQNWSEREEMPSDGWGKAYASSPLIKITGDGSFDSATLTELDAFKCAAQITDENDGWTDTLKKQLAREFGLVGYVDNNGYECLRKLPATKGDLEDPATAIVLNDIRRADSEVKITEPDVAYIYSEPFVRYNWNPAKKEYESIISVHGVTGPDTDFDGEPNWNTDYVEGDYVFSKEKLWENCVELHKLCGVIRKPPASLTDLKFANGNKVNADAIASRYIQRWVYWMGLKRVSFKVHFLCEAVDKPVREWQEGQRFKLTLPHETNAVTVECMAYRIAIDTKSPYHIEVGAFLLEELKLPDDDLIQDTYDDSFPELQDTYDDNEENIQDTY